MPYTAPATAPRRRFSRWLDRLRGRPVEWDLGVYERELASIDRLAADRGLARAPDAELAAAAAALKERARAGTERSALRVEAYAVAREASGRVLGMRPFDVQVLAGLALDAGRIVEAPTGEGKTLSAVLPAFLGALDGRGVHVLTFNDYLARRDAEWMGPVYRFLGLEVGHVVGRSTPEERRRAYRADVTYTTAREAGYDFLRQGLARDPDARVQRAFSFALVDEADSIMIDEARIPLVIAGADPAGEEQGRAAIAELVRGLAPGEHYATDEHRRNAFFTEEGQLHVQRLLGRGDLTDPANRRLATRLNQALHAAALLTRDVDYIVRAGRIEIIDELTGRVVRDRHWPDGLHRAVEAKEGLDPEQDGRVLGSITLQHFLGQYPRLSGMTGTALPAERELERFYGLPVTVIPPHEPCVRVDEPDLLYTHKEAKQAAIVAAVRRAHAAGRPVLIGTASVEESERLAGQLRAAGVACNVLNASNDEQEAAIIAEAGAPGAVTVSTNMAGRGTDIRLGGADGARRDEVAARGGLYVIGTNRFESRRIDNQLRGRAGRQGDPGASRFMISLEDELLTRFGVQDWIPARAREARQAEPVDDPVIHDKIALVQRIVEGQSFEIRQTLWNYTSLVDKQRQRHQELRQAVLERRGASRLAAIDPALHAELAARVPEAALVAAEAQVSLFHLDRLWAEHLAAVADIREGIYLTRLGGRDPLHDFFVEVEALFDQLERDLDEAVHETMLSATITAEGIDLEREGLRGPTATWTYLVNDNPFDWLGGLSAPGNMGLGIAAGVWGGLFVLREVLRKLVGRRGRRDGARPD